MGIWAETESDADRQVRKEAAKHAPYFQETAARFKQLANLQDVSEGKRQQCIKLSELAGELAQRMAEV